MAAKLSMFKVTFIGVLIEAMPFIILGAFISSLINNFVSEETIQKYLPKNRYLAIVAASLMGLVFPVCECAIVPIARRLVKKGVPISVAMPFMVSVPIINPVVLFSTHIAFQGASEFVWFRAGMGLVVAWALGFILHIAGLDSEDLLKEEVEHTHTSSCGCSDHGPQLVGLSLSPPKPFSRLRSIIHHTSLEFYDVGKLLIFGAVISALFKSFVPSSVVMGLGSNSVLSILAMMAFAFILSLCSEADAFIARTFTSVFSSGSVLAFLVLGPMIDIKNVLMLSGSFKKEFVVRLVALIFGLVFIVSLAANYVMGV